MPSQIHEISAAFVFLHYVNTSTSRKGISRMDQADIKSTAAPVEAHSADSTSEKNDSLEDVKAQVAAKRSQRGLLSFEKTANVIEVLSSYLKTAGQLLHDGTAAYVFRDNTRELICLTPEDPKLQLLLGEIGLYPKEYLTKNVVDALRLLGLREGTHTMVHAFSYFDVKTSTVYVTDFAGGIYRIAPDGPAHVSNGTDNVLFRSQQRWTPLSVNVQDIVSTRLNWLDWLLNGTQFVEGVFTPRDQCDLFMLWTLSLFFPQLFPTRVVLAVIGERGSGKSSLLRRLGQMLFGPAFNVSALTSRPEDFDAAITNQPLVVADNADDAPAWLPDKLAVVATGGSIKRRVLYTTNSEQEFPIVTNLAITSRTPNFKRDDIAERLLPLHVERFGEFVPEADLQRELQEQRDRLMEAVFQSVWKSVMALEDAASERLKTTFRMADFANFALKVSPAVLHGREAAAKMLQRLSSRQVEFSVEEDPLPGYLDTWLTNEAGGTVNPGRELSTSDLGTELERCIQDDVPWQRGNAKSFGQYLRQRKATLQQLFEISVRTGHAGQTYVTIHRRRSGDLGDVDDASQSVDIACEGDMREGVRGSSLPGHPDHRTRSGQIQLNIPGRLRKQPWTALIR